MMTQAGLWAAAGVAMLVAIAAVLGEWRRSRRRDLNKVGWVPWTFIQVMAFLAAMAAAALALKL